MQGVAPALLIYFLEFSTAGRYGWIVCFLYLVAVALRLARFNVLSHGKPTPGWFIGLPSPAAGMTLATYYPFTQTDVYAGLQGLPWHLLLTFLMIALTILMVSNVHYATLPRAGFRTVRGLLGLTLIVVILVFGIWQHDVTVTQAMSVRLRART